MSDNLIFYSHLRSQSLVNKVWLVCSCIVLLALLSPNAGIAQLTAPQPTSPAVMPIGGVDRTMTPPQSSSESMTFETGIDPREYHLGPGDVLQFRLWSANTSFYPQVSADQVLLLPNIGEFNVKDKTLAELKDEIYQKAGELFKKYNEKNSGQQPVTIALYQPRKIYVKVRGDVLSPNNYVLSGSTRADVAVDLANKLTVATPTDRDPALERRIANEQDRMKQLQSAFGSRKIAPASERFITVTHIDGTAERVDLVRFNAIHDPAVSPLLREGDVVLVPFRDPSSGSLGVYGAVQSPNDFEFVPGDSLSSAVKYAFGFAANADPHHVELTRMTPDGGAAPPKVYDLAAILSHQAPDVPLERDDRIVVRALHSVREAAVVVVRGKVNQPGIYPITDARTKLSDVIHDAGGLAAGAYPAAGIVLRHGHEERLTVGTPEDIAQIARLEDLGVSDTASFQKQLASRMPIVTVDMDRIFVQGDRSADITLRDGDEIVIPEQPTTVYVSGFVHNAGFVTYQPNAPLDYYIAEAGGYAEGATPSRTAVIKLRSKAWMDASDTKIEPGDEIFVPKEPDYSENYRTQYISTITTLALSIASFGLTLYGVFFKK